MSIQHAMIHFDLARGYVIEDLGSATGTFVDEECIKGESRPIGVGTELRFGDTTFRVVRAARFGPLVRGALGMAAGLAVFAGLLYFILPLLKPASGESIERVIKVRGREYPALYADTAFLRSRAWSMRHLRIQRVTDFDDDGVEEVWLENRVTGQEAVITFEAGDTSKWTVLGVFPGNCVPQGEDDQAVGFFPIILCEDTLWVHFQDDDYGDAGYQLQDHEGAVVYYRPRKAKPRRGRRGKAKKAATDEEEETFFGMLTPDAGLEVARLAIKNSEDLAAFLLDRGVPEPVHYFICEGAFPGIPHQAVLANGNPQKFASGCHGEISIDGELNGEPVAVALSPTGHQALIDDVITFYSGDPEGLFMPQGRLEIRDQLNQSAGFLQGGSTLRANPHTHVPATFDPVPDRPIRGGPRRLVQADLLIPAAPPAFTTNLVSEGMARIELPNCGTLKVWTGSFSNRGWQSLLPGTFSKVTSLGCTPGQQPLFSLDYTVVGTGMREAMVGNYKVRGMMETETDGRGIEVLRYRIAYRDETWSNPDAMAVPTDAVPRRGR